MIFGKMKILALKDYKNLHSFFWLFSLDLKSSKNDVQSVILKWIEKNNDYNISSWEIDTSFKKNYFMDIKLKNSLRR